MIRKGWSYCLMRLPRLGRKLPMRPRRRVPKIVTRRRVRRSRRSTKILAKTMSLGGSLKNGLRASKLMIWTMRCFFLLVSNALLFPKSCTLITGHDCICCTDLDEMKQYDWSKAVGEDTREKANDQKNKGRKATTPSVQGCIVFLIGVAVICESGCAGPHFSPWIASFCALPCISMLDNYNDGDDLTKSRAHQTEFLQCPCVEINIPGKHF